MPLDLYALVPFMACIPAGLYTFMPLDRYAFTPSGLYVCSHFGLQRFMPLSLVCC